MVSPGAGKGQKLPVEVILTIIEHVIPCDSVAIFPPSHVVTKTLVAFTQVCDATRRLASRLLHQHCAYLDSSERLQAFLRTLSCSNGSKDGHLSLRTPARMYLSPFGDQQDVDDLDINDLEDDLRDPALFSPLNDVPTATAVRDLLVAVAPTLRRLVIDMPLRSLYPEDDHQHVRPLLREGFSALVKMEEFVSVQDELYLNVHEHGSSEPKVWATCWPELRFLALYNLDLPDVWELLAGLPHLETVVFSRPDGAMDEEWRHERRGIDVKKRWLDALTANAERDGPTRRREVTMCFVDISSNVFNFAGHHPSWLDEDPEGRIRVTVCGVPFPDDDNPHSSERDATQNFVKQYALDATLFRGELFEDVT